MNIVGISFYFNFTNIGNDFITCNYLTKYLIFWRLFSLCFNQFLKIEDITHSGHYITCNDRRIFYSSFSYLHIRVMSQTPSGSGDRSQSSCGDHGPAI